jgi:putative ABC transport system permease protein
VAVSEQDFDAYPTTIFTRTRDDAVVAVQAILAATANPEHPNEAAVSRPSDALAAKDATDKTLNALLLGLGAVALLVGGVGVTNGGVLGYQSWPVVVPAWATIGGVVLATVLIGACAGVYPAWRAARISPTEALGAS